GPCSARGRARKCYRSFASCILFLMECPPCINFAKPLSTSSQPSSSQREFSPFLTFQRKWRELLRFPSIYLDVSNNSLNVPRGASSRRNASHVTVRSHDVDARGESRRLDV